MELDQGGEGPGNGNGELDIRALVRARYNKRSLNQEALLQIQNNHQCVGYLGVNAHEWIEGAGSAIGGSVSLEFL